MKRSPRQRSARPLAVVSAVAWCLSAWCLAACQTPAFALTPESPEVQAAIKKGLAYLATQNDEVRTGGVAVAAMAMVKNDVPLDHPKVAAAIKQIRSHLAAPKGGEFSSTSSQQIYNIGLSLIFLASTDGPAYRPEIDQLVARLVQAQKPCGGWGYPHDPNTGDTSMTQYGVLGYWEAYRAGANPPLQSWERVANWLIRTQDPSGAFGYQPRDPGSYTLVQQSLIRPSMAAAGLGSLYVCSDQFNVRSVKPATESKLPAALKPVKGDDGPRGGQRPASVDLARLQMGMQLGDRWFATNFDTNPKEYRHYYYYAFERYASFRELVEGKADKEPRWYTDIANVLLKEQGANGAWAGQCGATADTAFAVLFLSRSTRKSITKALGAGTLVGGRGLPTDSDKLAMRMGNVVRKPLAGPADKLLSVIENAEDPNFLAAVDAFAERALEPDEAQLPEHVVRLKKLAGGDAPAARAVALRALGRTRDLDHVPLLIFALRDPDWGVVKEARDGLRFISRKFSSIGPEIPTAEADPQQVEAQRRQAIKAWQEWYRSIRPEYVFEE